MQLEVILTNNLIAQDAILVHQMKSLNFENRDISFIGKARQAVVKKWQAFQGR